MSGQVRAATIQLLDRAGGVVRSVDVVLDPGAEEVATVEANDLPRYCKFVVDGGSNQFRTSILVRKDGEGSISGLSAE